MTQTGPNQWESVLMCSEIQSQMSEEENAATIAATKVSCGGAVDAWLENGVIGEAEGCDEVKV